LVPDPKDWLGTAAGLRFYLMEDGMKWTEKKLAINWMDSGWREYVVEYERVWRLEG
jgi:hypothetical protein